tara:strand:+ start:2343 stop:2567 length:225 start_codon:yes stop_codon:yes gene_type:complete
MSESEPMKSVHLHVAITESMNEEIQACLLRVREKMAADYGGMFSQRVTRSEVIRMALERGLNDIYDTTRFEEDE